MNDDFFFKSFWRGYAWILVLVAVLGVGVIAAILWLVKALFFSGAE